MAWITEPMYYLSYEQALTNAEIVFATFNSSGLGFTKEAICGILGNMWGESHVNPNMSEAGGGTTPAGAGAGLVQWTPATELTKHMGSSDSWNDGYFQMSVLIQELSPPNINNGGSSYGQWYDVGQWTYSRFVTSTDVAWSTECFMRCYERPGVLRLAQRIEYANKFYRDITGEGGSYVPGTLDKMIDWFKTREGKVYYSQTNRLGPEAYDCSSAVYYALIEGGFIAEGSMGWTGSLYDITLPSIGHKITREECKYGDIFVTNPYANAGHTGVFTSNTTIIHCNAYDNNIRETQFDGRNGDPPKYYFRINGGTTGGTKPDDEEDDEEDDYIILLLCDALNGWKW